METRLKGNQREIRESGLSVRIPNRTKEARLAGCQKVVPESFSISKTLSSYSLVFDVAGEPVAIVAAYDSHNPTLYVKEWAWASRSLKEAVASELPENLRKQFVDRRVDTQNTAEKLHFVYELLTSGDSRTLEARGRQLRMELAFRKGRHNYYNLFISGRKSPVNKTAARRLEIERAVIQPMLEKGILYAVKRVDGELVSKEPV